MNKYDIYGIGNALVDVEFEVEDSFFKDHNIGKGLMTLVDDDRQDELMQAIGAMRIKKQGGGSAANSMIANSQLGGRSFYSCKVANDDYGLFYLESLKEAGVDTNLNIEALEGGKTGRCLVMITPDADRTMNTFLGITSSLDAYSLNEQAMASSKYLYIEGYLVTNELGRNAMGEAKTMAEKHGVKTSLTLSDPSIVKAFRNKFDQLIGKGVDLLFCNEFEAMEFTGTDSLPSAREALKQVAHSFAITLGQNGATIFDGDTFIDIESYPVMALDSNGAGDMFAGAFLYGITHGHSFAQAGKLASLASSRVVAQFGPRLNEQEMKHILNKVTQPF